MFIDKQFFKDKSKYDLFKETVNSCDFYSFDLEMTGIELGAHTNFVDYDFPQLRYDKMKQVAQEYEAIQIGISFYIPKEKINPDESKEKVYLERTFCAYLFQNSPNKFLIDLYSEDSSFKSIFKKNIKSNPETLKFLNTEKFDFNSWIKESHHYNKLSKESIIIDLLKKHVNYGKIPDSVMEFSNSAKDNLIKTIHEVVLFFVFSNEKKIEISAESDFYANYVVGLNLPNFLKIKNINIIKSKTKKGVLLVEKSKASLDLKEFKEKFNLVDCHSDILDKAIKDVITFDSVYKYKYYRFINNYKSNEEVDMFLKSSLNDELGFSNLIKLLIESEKPIIGHNMLYDLLFIYDKFIDDLPNKLEDFLINVNKYFPHTIDTKILSHNSNKFSVTKLSDMLKSCEKFKYSSYIQIIPDVQNNFCLYDTEIGKEHDAGYDARITGRLFIYLIKGLEYNFIVDDSILKVSKEFIKFDDLLKSGLSNIVVYNINKGFPYNNFYFNKDQSLLSKQNELIIDSFNRNVFMLIFKEKDLIIFEAKEVISSERFIFKLVKLNQSTFVVEVLNYNDDEDIKQAYKELSNKPEISSILKYKEYYDNYATKIN